MDKSVAEPVLGNTSGPIAVRDLASVRAASWHMATQATRELLIFSHDLDAAVYDQPDFLGAVRRLALQGVHVPVRILLFDAEPAVHNGHRLVELARQLTSRIHIRRVPEEFQDQIAAYLIADGRGYVLRRQANVPEGTADFNNPLEVRRLQKQFEQIWERSDLHQELRRLHL